MQDKTEEIVIKDEFMFGTAGELRLDSQRKPVLVDVDNEELAHPSVRIFLISLLQLKD